MMGRPKLSASIVALTLFWAAGAASVQAADIEDPGCTISGAAGIGYMFDWQEVEFDGVGSVFNNFSGDVDWDTPLGEAGGLVTCGGFNAQADFAYYDHSTDLADLSNFGKADLGDLDAANSHFGGALFWRDPSMAALGVSASWVNQDVFSKDVDLFRFGVFGEFYADILTLGASAHYFAGDFIQNSDTDGFELAAYGRFYAMPDLSLTLRGDALLSTIEPGTGSNDADFDGWAVTGEAEYLVWDKGLSIFGGARYAERTLETDGEGDVDFYDTQVYAGLKFYFGQDGSLMDRQRTGLIDNTSTFNEKLPNWFSSEIAAALDVLEGIDLPPPPPPPP
ncbi:MAG: hypothetical protein ACOZAM_20770 [Pseudomonadota bacterium]